MNALTRWLQRQAANCVEGRLLRDWRSLGNRLLDMVKLVVLVAGGLDAVVAREFWTLGIVAVVFSFWLYARSQAVGQAAYDLAVVVYLTTAIGLHYAVAVASILLSLGVLRNVMAGDLINLKQLAWMTLAGIWALGLCQALLDLAAKLLGLTKSQAGWTWPPREVDASWSVFGLGICSLRWGIHQVSATVAWLSYHLLVLSILVGQKPLAILCAATILVVMLLRWSALGPLRVSLSYYNEISFHLLFNFGWVVLVCAAGLCIAMTLQGQHEEGVTMARLLVAFALQFGFQVFLFVFYLFYLPLAVLEPILIFPGAPPGLPIPDRKSHELSSEPPRLP